MPSVELERTPDILAGLGADKPPGLLLVGFAAETADVAAYAAAKLAAKRVDLMVANDVSAPGTGPAPATNAVLLLGADGWSDEVSLRSKREVARCRPRRRGRPPRYPEDRRSGREHGGHRRNNGIGYYDPYWASGGSMLANFTLWRGSAIISATVSRHVL